MDVAWAFCGSGITAVSLSSYFEMESSGLREEIRYRYRYREKPRSESFPYRLADGQWHKIALTISASHLLLHIDCNSLPHLQRFPRPGARDHGSLGAADYDDTSGYDFCAEGLNCRENSVCKNRNNRAACECKSGFASLHGDSTYCEEQDKCASDQRSCDVNAICTNAVRGHLCTCRPGYVGNGTVCRAFCEEGCRNGRTCVSPNICLCPSGFTGFRCEKDIDECAKGFIHCHHHSRCIKLPGWYHCECRGSFHDDGSYLLDRGSCVDIDECATRTHPCWNESTCVNLPRGFDCLCPTGSTCTGDCPLGGDVKNYGQNWSVQPDHCTYCSCKNGHSCCWVEIECLQNNWRELSWNTS